MHYSRKRKIEVLLWVEERKEKNLPFTLTKKSKLTPAQKKGISFEHLIEHELIKHQLNFSYNTWFEFEDMNGFGYCQPDFLIYLPDSSIIILEAKYTYTPAGDEELKQLYSPIVQEYYSPPSIHLAQVFHNFSAPLPSPYTSTLPSLLKKEENYWHLL